MAKKQSAKSNRVVMVNCKTGRVFFGSQRKPARRPRVMVDGRTGRLYFEGEERR